MFIPVMGFLIMKARSYYDYSLSFYMTVVVLTMVVFVTVLIYKIGAIVMLIEKYEEFIKNRKHKPIWQQLINIDLAHSNISLNRNGI